MKYFFVPFAVTLLLGAALADEPKPGDVKARLRFVPDGGPWKGETAFKGAS